MQKWRIFNASVLLNEHGHPRILLILNENLLSLKCILKLVSEEMSNLMYQYLFLHNLRPDSMSHHYNMYC